MNKKEIKEFEKYLKDLSNERLLNDLYFRGMDFMNSPLSMSTRTHLVALCKEEILKRMKI